MKREKPSSAHIERRNLVSSIFVTILLGLAFQEMLAPARDSFHTDGFSLGLIALLSVFFLTGLRFFIGAQLHLISDRLLALGGKVWFFDFAIISLEMLIMTFMGGVSSPQSSALAKIDFVEFLIVLLGLDIFWVVAQWIMGRIWQAWRRSFIPWKWASINAVIITVLLAYQALIGSIYTIFGYFVLIGISIVAFVVDVIFTDYYKLI